jgi:hypothetical protein
MMRDENTEDEDHGFYYSHVYASMILCVWSHWPDNFLGQQQEYSKSGKKHTR